MALTSIQSATAYGYGQLQRQIALRNAEQLEAKAQALAGEAALAREDAERAVSRADDLDTDADSARNAANNAQQLVATSESALKLGGKIAEQADKIYEAMQSDDDSQKLYGRNGRSSNSSYTAGSIFKLAG